MNYLVHGFNVKDKGEGSVGCLRPFLPTWEMFVYGWKGLFGVMFTNKKNATKLKAKLDNNFSNANYSNVWAHSNGCAITVNAAKQGAIIYNAILINPALPVNTVFPETMKNIIVIYTKHDKATKAARIGNKIPLLGLFVPDAWGAMGTQGAKVPDSRVINLDFSQFLDGHSAFFERENLESLMPLVKEHMVLGE